MFRYLECDVTLWHAPSSHINTALHSVLLWFLCFTVCAETRSAAFPGGACGTNGHANARLPSVVHLKCTIQLQQSQGAKVGQCVEPSCEGCDSPLSCSFPRTPDRQRLHCWELLRPCEVGVSPVFFQLNKLSYCYRAPCIFKGMSTWALKEGGSAAQLEWDGS